MARSRPEPPFRGPSPVGWGTLAALLLALWLAPEAPGKPPAEGRLRVGASGDYAPFSLAGEDGAPSGFDPEVARLYAKERGRELEFVRFRWPDLLRDLEAGRFDLAMSGITVTPRRSLAGRFSAPVAESGAVVLMREPERWKNLDELDAPDLRIGVNAGGYLEQVARRRFPHATLLAIPNNRAVREALLAESLDAAVSDSLEAARWRRGAEELGQSEPFTRDRKAYLVRADQPALAADLDAWLLEREKDGSLAELRRKQLGAETAAPVATPLGALFAAVDERLSLMPWVAAAKQRAGLPIEAPEREAQVLEAAVAAAQAAAAQAKAEPLPEAPARAVFTAQVEAAKQLQAQTLRNPTFKPEEPVPDLETQLRPALLRIGDRIAALLVALPHDLDARENHTAARESLRTAVISPSTA